jgi:hypothetical protein
MRDIHTEQAGDLVKFRGFKLCLHYAEFIVNSRIKILFIYFWYYVLGKFRSLLLLSSSEYNVPLTEPDIVQLLYLLDSSSVILK